METLPDRRARVIGNVSSSCAAAAVDLDRIAGASRAGSTLTGVSAASLGSVTGAGVGFGFCFVDLGADCSDCSVERSKRFGRGRDVSGSDGTGLSGAGWVSTLRRSGGSGETGNSSGSGDSSYYR